MICPLRLTRFSLLAAVAILLAATGHLFAAEAEIAPLASQSLLLDGQVVGNRVVAVGERGHLLVSTDRGRTWKQSPVPTRTSLTSVFFTDDEHGWAAGHDTTILRTRNGGAGWETVFSDPERGAPILDLWFRDAGTGYAVGAYGLLLTTTNGGATWEERALPGEDGADIDLHFNQIRALEDGRLVISAEAGRLYSSADGGQWRALDLPYEGSMFGVLPLGNNRLLAYGLRGHLFLSGDGGRRWAAVATGTAAMLTDAVVLSDGRIIVVGLAGTVLLSSDGGEHFTLHPQPDRAGFARVLDAGDGTLVLLGNQGSRRLELSNLKGSP